LRTPGNDAITTAAINKRWRDLTNVQFSVPNSYPKKARTCMGACPIGWELSIEQLSIDQILTLKFWL